MNHQHNITNRYREILTKIVKEARNPAVQSYNLRQMDDMNQEQLVRTISGLQMLESQYQSTVSNDKIDQLLALLEELQRDERVDDGGPLSQRQMEVRVAIYQVRRAISELKNTGALLQY